ncbi:hypothetical protein EK21DRAFT_87614 [Setomelanomma holmii]|uniref:Uncharacterized protein n=1 Tax=Setomelanomma holmii TaxID=210430 RepID=A0A9P4HCA5_9PLEO|nr:hypothetical protein EK21DRAFT_87614 [Setomelanomma holmii]
MHISATLLFALASAAVARPQDTSIAAGSRKNVYLATCTTRGLLDSPADSSSTVIYYNGPSSSRDPSDVATVSQPARDWEGSTKRTYVNGASFTSSINAGAGDLPKSQIAGTATLGGEDFVCFVDGTSTFKFNEGLLGLGSTNCKADYWCASTSV